MTRPAIFVGLFLALLAIALQGVQGDEELEKVPSEVQCRPYIEKALKDLGTGSLEESSAEVNGGVDEEGDEDRPPLNEQGDEPANDDDDKKTDEQSDDDSGQGSKEVDNGEDNEKSGERSTEDNSNEADGSDDDNVETIEVTSVETVEDQSNDDSDEKTDGESVEGADDDNDDRTDEAGTESSETTEDDDSKAETTVTEESEVDSKEKKTDDDGDSGETDETKNDSADDNEDSKADVNDDSKANDDDGKSEESKEVGSVEKELTDNCPEDKDDDNKKPDDNSKETTGDIDEDYKDSKEDATKKSVEESTEDDSKARGKRQTEDEGADEEESEDVEVDESQEGEEKESMPEEDLIKEIEIPENLRPRDHISQLLKLDQENEVKERAIQRGADIILRDLKRLYDNAIKPLETLYKYRDLSNRHFGDPEIFSKPLVLFMGPWSGGKSSIINYLLDAEYKQNSLRTGGLQECLEEPCKPPNGTDAGAEPSPAYFNILMHGEEEEVLDGTQLAADWTFSGLQKFGQGMLDRLRGLRLNNKLLEKVNIVEIPGILEIRKQVQRLFPFNDACQWFIDRADIIFLVYDPSKLDVGPETEAILDQLKGREYQTRIVLNKADQVKPEELMRVQGALIWNISPLMSSAEPPIMYSVSLWSLPYEAGAPTRLLYAQERAFLRDLRSAIDKRVEHKIASARRFAVRVRNHAKMVDCYLTTYYNHKTFFGNKKEISDRIIENPQNYHIYEGLSTLTNISRYDLPDPDVYRDFFRLNSLYDFKPLSSTCTYFRGCPINRLDVAIAYDLPELVGKYKKSVEAAMNEGETSTPPS